jgi:hypothetical protein
VGAKTVRARSLIAELTHRPPVSTRDPARVGFAHRGTDGPQVPGDRETYDTTIEWLRQAVERAKVGRSERIESLRRLAEWERESGQPAGRNAS